MALEPPCFVSDPNEEPFMSVVGHSSTQSAPIFGQVSIEDSSDVHFGDKHIYNGPVVIKQLVCAKDSLDFRSDKSKDSVESEVASKLPKVDDNPQPEIRKGFSFSKLSNNIQLVNWGFLPYRFLMATERSQTQTSGDWYLYCGCNTVCGCIDGGAVLEASLNPKIPCGGE